MKQMRYFRHKFTQVVETKPGAISGDYQLRNTCFSWFAPNTPNAYGFDCQNDRWRAIYKNYAEFAITGVKIEWFPMMS